MSDFEATVPAGQFAAAVKWAARFISARPAAPIQAGLRLESDGNALHIGAMNESASAVATVAHDGDGHGVVVVSGRLLSALAATFPARGEVGLAASGSTLAVTAGRWAGTLPTMSVKDYPSMPGAPAESGRVEAEEFAWAVEQVSAATVTDADKPWPSRSIGLDFQDGLVALVGTDRARVAGTVCGYRGSAGSAVVLAAPLAEAAKGLAGPDPVRVGLSDSQMSMSSPTRQVVMPLMDQSKYNIREYAAVIKHNNPDVATVNRRALTEPLKRALLMADDLGVITLRFAAGTLTIGADAKDLSRTGADEVEIEYDGPEITYRFGAHHFTAALESAPDGPVSIAVTDQERRPGIPNPIVFTVAGTPWRHVLMPRR